MFAFGRQSGHRANRAWLNDPSHRCQVDAVFSHHELIHVIATNGYWIVALAIGLECLGLPLPGESILIAAAIYAGSSHALNILLLIGTAAFGAILGNTVGFWIGREGGYRLLLR